MSSLVLYIIICFLIVLLVMLCYITFNLLRKNEIYESWITNFNDRARKTYDEMKSIDERQMFESDDEVGIIFDEMKNLITELNDKLGELDAEENDEE